MSKVLELKAAVENGKSKLVAGLAQEAIDEGAKAAELLEAMIQAMDVVGERFSKGEIFVPEMLVAAKAMNKGMEVVKPLLTGADSESLGKCIIGTVKGDLHDIGKPRMHNDRCSRIRYDRLRRRRTSRKICRSNQRKS